MQSTNSEYGPPYLATRHFKKIKIIFYKVVCSVFFFFVLFFCHLCQIILNAGAEAVLDKMTGGAGQLIVNMTKTGCYYSYFLNE